MKILITFISLLFAAIASGVALIAFAPILLSDPFMMTANLMRILMQLSLVLAMFSAIAMMYRVVLSIDDDS